MLTFTCSYLHGCGGDRARKDDLPSSSGWFLMSDDGDAEKLNKKKGERKKRKMKVRKEKVRREAKQGREMRQEEFGRQRKCS